MGARLLAALFAAMLVGAPSGMLAARAGRPRPAALSGTSAPTRPAAQRRSSDAGTSAVTRRPFYHPVGCRRAGPPLAYRSGPRRRVVALSFDDGPARDTLAFVRMLEAQRARATFFLIGREVTPAYRQLLRRELRDGDALGDHTFTHADLTRTADTRGQLTKTIEAIRGLTGYTPCVFRPPYGAYDEPVVRQAASLGLATVLWNVDPADWARPGVRAIERRVLAQVQPGSIIISHDGGGPRGQTLAAYATIIETLRARGFRFETVPQLLGFDTIYRRCVRECEGAGIRRPLPGRSVVEPG